MAPIMLPATAPPPSCCAGLRQTLLKGWQQGFPLHASPFRQMAARSGSTPRELLNTCLDLQRRGALQSIQVHWGAGLRRQRWRLAFAGGAAARLLGEELAALPGCLRIERASPSTGLPSLWAEVEALDEAALQRQLERLPLQPVARLRLPLGDEARMQPCADVPLAACVEQGLRLCAKPFADCARRMGCSEQRLLIRLHALRRAGQLDSLVLRPPPSHVPQPATLLLWQKLQPSAAHLAHLAHLARLRELPGLEGLHSAPASDDWPWQLSLVLAARPGQGADALREQLAGLGLEAAPDALVPLLVEQPREQALLFGLGQAPT